jgi:ORF6N domain
MTNVISMDVVVTKIIFIRGKKVMLDKDLALLYEVKPVSLRQQVKRNKDRFPEDFMFHLTEEESKIMVSQNVIPSIQSLGGYLPYAFTEQGVAMLSSILRSKRAVQVNIQIMRAFVQLRRFILTNADLRHKIEAMEKKYDKQFAIVFQAIKQLLEPPPLPAKKPIGFHRD